VPRDFVVKQLVLPFRAGSDIVYDPFFTATGTGAWNDNPDVTPSLFGCTVRKAPSNNVSYVVVVKRVGIVQDLTKAGEVALQVGNSTVVDVTIRTFTLPELGVEPEVLRHVLMDKLLQIDTESAIASYDEIG
tara:strand:+ start:1080 stop:1475 length:396 start_codon:yes stop_codon:yes gene_type:complete